MFGIFISQACKEVSKIDTVQKEPIKVEVTLQAEDFYNLNHEWLTQNFESLVQNASGLKQLIKEEQIQKNSVQNDGVIQIPVNKLKDKMEKKSTSSDEFEIFRVLTKEGEERFYTLFLEYATLPSNGLNKQVGNNSPENKDVYLAWNYERFYAVEDENNEIIYPISIPATSLNDTSKVVTINVYEDGTKEIISSSSSINKEIANQEIEIMSLEPVEIDANGSGLEPVPTGIPFPLDVPQGIHLMITSIRLGETGDDNSAELQLFIDDNDDYSKKAGKKLDFFFDKWYTTKGPKIEQKGSDKMYYKIIDVNAANFTYSFVGLEGGSQISSANTTPANHSSWRIMPGFPIIALSQTNNRLFFSDDDEVYEEFAVRRSWELKRTISTWDASTDTYSDIVHKIDANFEWSGSSDDPIKGSAARRISYNTMYSGVFSDVPGISNIANGTYVTFGILIY